MLTKEEKQQLLSKKSTLDGWRGFFLTFAIFGFIAAQILFLVIIFYDNQGRFLLGFFGSLIFSIILLIIRSSIFSYKVKTINFQLKKDQIEKKKKLEEQQELEKVERIYNKIKELDKNNKDE